MTLEALIYIMAIFPLYSKKQKALRGEVPDIFTYNNIPQPLRVQIVHIIKDAIGKDRSRDVYSQKAYKFVYNTLCREYGKFQLIEAYNEADSSQVINFFLESKNDDEVIDVIELFFKYIDNIIRHDSQYHYFVESKITPDEAIDELNQRFKEHGIGFQYEGREIIRVDSSFAHSAITKPTISLLWSKKFKGANEEFLKAHEHYRHGRNKECLTECLKAFESTMKIICKEKGWSYNQTDNASKLIQICFQQNLVPAFTQNQFTSLQSLLVTGIPTIRNKVGAHDQGQVPQEVHDEMTRYGLNLTGTNIIFLVELSGLA